MRALQLCCSLLLIFHGVLTWADIDPALEHSIMTPTAPAGTVINEEYFDKLNVTVLHLGNGMNVYLRPSNDPSDQVMFQLSALGGLSAFSDEQLGPAKYCGSIAWASGLGDLSSENLVDFSFKYSLEFSSRTRPFQRTIEGNCPKDSAPQLIAMLHHFFTNSNFTQEGLDTFVKRTLDAVQHRSLDCDTYFEDAFLAFNSNNAPVLRPTTKKSLRKITLDDARTAFADSFRSPQEFTCVIVGQFELATLKELVIKYLASIPAKEPAALWPGLPPPSEFPQGKPTSELQCGEDKETLTRITYPITLKNTPRSIHQLEITTQLIETRLRDIFFQKYQTSYGIDIGYQFPHYPQLQPAWLTLQFRSPRKSIKQILAIIHRQVDDLYTKGPTENEVLAVQQLLQRTSEFWSQRDSFWVATLSNYLKWGWPVTAILDERQILEELTVEGGHQLLRDHLPINNYTTVMMHYRKG